MRKILLIISCFVLLAGTNYFSYPVEIIAKTIKKSTKKISKLKSNFHFLVDSLSINEKSFGKLFSYLPQYNDYSTQNNFQPISYLITEINDNNALFSDKIAGKRLLEKIEEWVGAPYRSGGRSKRGVDCSNFTSVLLKEALGIHIPPGASCQARLFKPIKFWENLRFGDLIFFAGRNRRAHHIGHVGIYLANGLFVHSSSGKGVIFTHISEGYYKERFKQGGRFYREDWEYAQILTLFQQRA